MMSNNKRQRGLGVVPCSLKNEVVDRLSNLPGHIIDKILSHLSLRDAVRTSVLSNKWRYHWVTLPDLVFGRKSVPVVSTRDKTLLNNKLVSIIDHVIILHTGPIHKFKLSHLDLKDVSDIDRWVLFLSRGSVKEFILEVWNHHHYKLHSSIYLCQELIHLQLNNCRLKPPSNFNGFKSLKRLDLQHTTMAQLALEHMISSCPLLERLRLIHCDGRYRLNIHAPNLLWVDIGGGYNEVHFRDTFHLAVVHIALFVNSGIERELLSDQTGNLIKFFACLPHIKRFEVRNHFLKYLAGGGTVPEKLPTPCLDLSFLAIDINFYVLEENEAALCLLRSSPNLQELEMVAQQADALTVPSIVKNFESFPFNHLRLIKVGEISGTRQELNFIKFMLANTPILERMTVQPASTNTELKLLKELLRFRRASMFAEIVYLDTQPVED